MARGWYLSRQHQQRLLSFKEIADACCIQLDRVEDWLAAHHLKRVRPGEDLLDAAEVVDFLVRHDMPVSPALLPANTKKILFIAASDSEFRALAEKFDYICRFFAERSNILVETAVAGRYADLCIFAFAPHVIVIFIKEYDKLTANTLGFLSSIPERRTILLVDDLIKKAVDDGLLALPADLIISEAWSIEQLRSQLHSAFDTRS